MMIIVVGIPGSGKTSILREVQQAMPHVQVVNYGNKMLEAAEVSDRDLLRKMPTDKQRSIGISAAQGMVKEYKGTTIVDTHALVRTEFGYCPGLPKEVLEILSPKICAIVECAPSVILQRRTHDEGIRKRDVESEEKLSLHQKLSHSYLTACCMITGALFCQIDNSSPHIQENAALLINAIKSMESVDF
jgi:adenylate kinase